VGCRVGTRVLWGGQRKAGEENDVSRFFRVLVDRDALIDAYFAYVTDPHPSRNDRHSEVLDEGPVPPEVLEKMVLEGVDQRRDIADLVTYCLVTGWGQSSPRPRRRTR
jgi:hypothetical protein